jgi:hypothetical protein
MSKAWAIYARRSMVALFKRCAVLGVLLRTDDSVYTVEQMDDDSGGHQMLFGVKAVLSEAERNKMRTRVRDLARNTWADGGIWATTPFGYRTVRDPGTGKVLRNRLARRLEVEPEEAEVVRRVFVLLREHSHAGVAAILNREGARHGRPGPWTHNTVKDLWRRREFYIGKVTRLRGAESTQGKHEAILSDEEYRDAEIAVRNRQSKKGRTHPNAKRVYLLSGIAYCGECGHRLRGVPDPPGARSGATTTCSDLAALPSETGKIVEFRQKRRVAASLPDAIALLGAEGKHEEVRDALSGLVARVVVRDRRVVRIEPVPAARPFFRVAGEDGLISVAPPDGLEPPTPALGRLRSVH